MTFGELAKILRVKKSKLQEYLKKWNDEQPAIIERNSLVGLVTTRGPEWHKISKFIPEPDQHVIIARPRMEPEIVVFYGNLHDTTKNGYRIIAGDWRMSLPNFFTNFPQTQWAYFNTPSFPKRKRKA